MTNENTNLQTVKEWSPTVLKRMQHIERCLFWRGELKRADLIDEFGINPIQAAKDFRAYMEQFPNSMEYKSSIRRYVPMPGFKPQVIFPATLDEFMGLPSISVPIDTWPLPIRKAAPSVLQVMVSAVRERRMIEVRYQSMSGKQPAWRWLSPHAFASDGERWHVRAFCHTHNEFRDFVLGRVLETGSSKGSEVHQEDDLDWHTQVYVVVMPNPSLALEQRKAIATEYQIPHDTLKLTLKIRKSMLFYLNSKFVRDYEGNPAAQQLIVATLS
ncbi:WYL domain-containing protein [Chitinibacter tainanensis]|uniref:WYL domain-containing protein n=1 Tax=Chitinibacter tainanensis TaxID=230667 RepID=UPI00068492D9|nr:WYL domain-containing protein [Chitinibacter tainanensis]